MLDRKKLLSHISDPDEKVLVSRICDILEKAQISGKVVFTDFLNPKLQMVVSDMINFSGEIIADSFGGYDGAERRMYSFSRFCNVEEDEYPISVVGIRTKNKKVFSHRDYLGSVLGLGIKREKIGDIVISDDIAYVVCEKGIADYINMHLSKVGNTGVICGICDTTVLSAFERKMSKSDVTVSSLRLDAIVGAMCKKSRGNAVKLIDSGLVCVNYNTILNHSYMVKNDDIISVRGYGKSVINTDERLTKKGRIHITVNHYI